MADAPSFNLFILFMIEDHNSFLQNLHAWRRALLLPTKKKLPGRKHDSTLSAVIRKNPGRFAVDSLRFSNASLFGSLFLVRRAWKLVSSAYRRCFVPKWRPHGYRCLHVQLVHSYGGSKRDEVNWGVQTKRPRSLWVENIYDCRQSWETCSNGLWSV